MKIILSPLEITPLQCGKCGAIGKLGMRKGEIPDTLVNCHIFIYHCNCMHEVEVVVGVGIGQPMLGEVYYLTFTSKGEVERKDAHFPWYGEAVHVVVGGEQFYADALDAVTNSVSDFYRLNKAECA